MSLLIVGRQIGWFIVWITYRHKGLRPDVSMYCRSTKQVNLSSFNILVETETIQWTAFVVYILTLFKHWCIWLFIVNVLFGQLLHAYVAAFVTHPLVHSSCQILFLTKGRPILPQIKSSAQQWASCQKSREREGKRRGRERGVCWRSEGVRYRGVYSPLHTGVEVQMRNF